MEHRDIRRNPSRSLVRIKLARADQSIHRTKHPTVHPIVVARHYRAGCVCYDFIHCDSLCGALRHRPGCYRYPPLARRLSCVGHARVEKTAPTRNRCSAAHMPAGIGCEWVLLPRACLLAKTPASPHPRTSVAISLRMPASSKSARAARMSACPTDASPGSITVSSRYLARPRARATSLSPVLTKSSSGPPVSAHLA